MQPTAVNPDKIGTGPVMLFFEEIRFLAFAFQLLPLTFFGYCSRKEVFQPHLPVRLPCYDLAPVTGFTLGRSLRLRTSGTPSFHGLTGGVYKARERIHRSIADLRLLANPTSRGRVADPDPNCEQLFEIGILLPGSCPLYCPL
jgi:hypothetical protein